MSPTFQEDSLLTELGEKTIYIQVYLTFGFLSSSADKKNLPAMHETPV